MVIGSTCSGLALYGWSATADVSRHPDRQGFACGPSALESEVRLSDILLVVLLLVVLPACLVGIVKLIESPPAAVTRLIRPGRDEARQACSYHSQEAGPGGPSDLDLLTLAEEAANQAAAKSDRYRPLLRALAMVNEDFRRADQEMFDAGVLLAERACRKVR